MRSERPEEKYDVEPSIYPMNLSLERLLRPRSIAIVGASDKPGSLGASVLANLDRAGFAGDVHLVNPRRSTIGDRLCVGTVDDLPAGIDAALLAIPRAGVIDAVKALARRQVGAAIIFSAGFAEDGAQGLADQREIARIAEAAGMIVEGPNCLGLVNFRDRIPLTFIELPEACTHSDRCVGIVSQSGAMAAVLATTMIARDVPLSCYISTGNEAASGVEDYLEYLVIDPQTSVIALIVEHVRQPARFLAAARAARAAGKQVVLLHPGRSAAGAASAATHTGAMAGDHAVMRLHTERAGVLLVDTLELLGDAVEILARCSRPTAEAVGIVAESGAFKAMMLDQAESAGLTLPVLSDADSPALRAALPPFVPVSNPLDITAQGLVDPGLYGRTIEALLDDDRIETVLVTLIQTLTATSHVKLMAVIEAVQRLRPVKPVIVTGVDEGGAVFDDDIGALRALGVPFLPTAERALRTLALLANAAGAPSAATKAQPIALAGLIGNEGTIPEFRAKQLLGGVGIAFVGGELAKSEAAAIIAAERLGYPVVIKAQAAALPHKSDAGGVVVGLADKRAVAAGWKTVHANIAMRRPGLLLDGILIEPMAKQGVELIIGARSDPAWGPTILVGSGGVSAELLHDVRLLPPDLPVDAIETEIGKLRLAPLLTGFRGAPPMDLRAVAELVECLGRIMLGTPAIREIDLNPVVVYPRGQGAIALDALIQT